MGRRGVASRKRARAEVESGPSAVTSTTVSRSAPPSLPAPVGFKLLLDDEESLPEKGPTAGVVVLSDSENDDATTSSTSSTLSSWPSLRAGSSELTTSESSLCSEDEDDSKSSSHWRESPLKKRRRCPSVPKEKQPEVVERDGWLYPAELLPLLCEPDQGGASPSLKGCATATVSAGSTVDNNVESCFHTVAEEDRRARGITILGQSVSGMASPPTTSSRSAVAPPHIAAYSQRYEEMDALADLPGTDAEGLFVVGDEIGGMRFAP
ncbi:hypothetical protein DQ04_01201110 [Trypanosoma grayi]|uniref:hypothetical protein n=1 Tax=Trypanosoma grayi TaxID=71804 RepID=UPI0004F41231|nr:hypothetical protein DQ04_01201110 [Trypanosoma grayi]KEG13125.1 hypothetical protein DQ04_01201110 [Trypanosoma grayi]